MRKRNAFYAQSGGVTAVINTTACAVIETARKHRRVIGKVLAGRNGIIGALTEDLIDTSKESLSAIAALRSTPGGAFGSCRYKLGSIEENRSEYDRLIAVFKAHNIGFFFYNGGGDSQDTANKISQMSRDASDPITCIGIPKTVDNDMPLTDTCPGFGSVAKFVAISTREAGLDVASMYESSTKVFVLEVMGRHTGWIAASAGLAKVERDDPPHVILFPEIPFEKRSFLSRVRKSVEKCGYCVVVASEGTRFSNGRFLADAGTKDAFGHTQLGGLAPTLVSLITNGLGYKCHWSVADYLQRAARHIASATDVEQAYAVGKAAVEFAVAGKDAVMPVIVRNRNKPYKWSIGEASLSKVANVEKKMPRGYISRDGYSITAKAREYLEPLIVGEDYPTYKNGMPQYARLKLKLVKRKLPAFEIRT